MLYLDLRRDEGYETLVSLAGAGRQHFAEAGCPAMDADRAFTPHVTIAKLSKLSVGKRWRNDQVCKKIPQVCIPMACIPYPVCGALHPRPSSRCSCYTTILHMAGSTVVCAHAGSVCRVCGLSMVELQWLMSCSCALMQVRSRHCPAVLGGLMVEALCLVL